MHHSVSLITTIAASFGVALIMGLIANRLKLPALVGYLFAGILLGPTTPGFIADLGLSAQLAEIGVILLMFGVGLHFSVEDLLEVRRIAVPGSILRMIIATAMGAGLAACWGWGLGASLVFGLALSVASTVVLIKALEQHGTLRTMNGQIAIGWLVVEDLAMVLVLVLLPPLSGWLGGNVPAAMAGSSLWLALAIALLKITIFVAFMLLAGRRIFPWLLGYVASTGSRELFSLSVIATAVGIAYGSAKLFGVSFALGAFFAGMIMRESHLSHRAAQESLPLRDAFSVLFFVSVGMLFDPSILLHQPLRVLAVVAIIIFGKSLVSFLLVLAFRYPLNTALTVSAGLAQIGEFSFILTGLGVSLGLLPHEGQSLVLAGAIASISLNQFVFKAVAPALNWIKSRPNLARVLEMEKSVDPLAELPMTVSSNYVTGHIVIVGYGRVGKRIGETLIAKGLPFVIAEQNREVVEKLRAGGLHAVAGDSADPVVLIQAHIARAQMLVIAIPDTLKALKMIETARLLNPDIKILARTHSEEEEALFHKENVDMVFLGEHELARNMTHHLLHKLNHNNRQ